MLDMNTTPLGSGPAVLISVLRWTARILSLLAVGLVLLLAIGEGLDLTQFTVRELVLFAFFPLGVCVGMLLAWRWEGWGGSLTVASLTGFYLADYLASGGFPRGVAFIAFAAPGFLFLLCGWWARSARVHSNVRSS